MFQFLMVLSECFSAWGISNIFGGLFITFLNVCLGETFCGWDKVGGWGPLKPGLTTPSDRVR